MTQLSWASSNHQPDAAIDRLNRTRHLYSILKLYVQEQDGLSETERNRSEHRRYRKSKEARLRAQARDLDFRLVPVDAVHWRLLLRRFRDTLVVDMLSRGASPYDVAKMLGDTIETVERHYTPFVRELRERVRAILESDAGLESALSTDRVKVSVTPVSQLKGTIQ